MKKVILIFTIFACFNLIYAKEANIFNTKVGIEKGDYLPQFQLYDYYGKKIDMSQFKGKAMMLNFWATWCPPCRSEMPSIEKLYQKTKDKDFVIIAVSVDSKPGTYVKKFIEDNRYNFPVYYDRGSQLSRKFLVRSIPLTYIVDQYGVIVEKEVGAADWSNYDINRLIGD